MKNTCKFWGYQKCFAYIGGSLVSVLKTVVVKRAEACDIYTSVMFGRGLDFSEEQLL